MAKIVDTASEWIGDLTVDLRHARKIIFISPAGTEMIIDPLDFYMAMKYCVKKSHSKVVEREVEE